MSGLRNLSLKRGNASPDAGFCGCAGAADLTAAPTDLACGVAVLFDTPVPPLVTTVLPFALPGVLL